jgi:hypothetical protein
VRELAAAEEEEEEEEEEEADEGVLSEHNRAHTTLSPSSTAALVCRTDRL